MGICWGQMWEYHHEMDTPNVQWHNPVGLTH
jgi:hypothetical protein